MNKTCPNPATYRYTWPGRDENFVCIEHGQILKSISLAMGLHLQLIPITFEVNCSQILSKE